MYLNIMNLRKKITKDHILNLLYKKVPEFKPVAEKMDREDLRESDYAVAGEFAHFLLKAYKNDEANVLKSGAEFIETLVSRGDSYTHEVAVVGYIEALQNVLVAQDIPEDAIQADLDAIYKILKPESKKYWDELIVFWKQVEKSNSPKP